MKGSGKKRWAQKESKEKERKKEKKKKNTTGLRLKMR